MESFLPLTQTVKKGGCAAKLPAYELRQVLAGLEIKRGPDVLVDGSTLDDAALIDLKDGRLLIQTIDFFTPIVDDPFDFGAIAAANSISDVYAMGGLPVCALTVLAFPAATLPLAMLNPLMKGALSVMDKAGVSLVGGHTIDDETLKLGFSVTGYVEKGKQWVNSGAQVGDFLILTKGLGTGTITTALKSRQADQAWVKAAVESMTTLNAAVDLLSGVSVHAATDITGFGLAGHAMQMAQTSQKSFRIQTKNLPLIHGALESLKNKNLNRAHRTNAEYVKDGVEYLDISEELKYLTVDAQTSGGLLLAISEHDGQTALQKLKTRFPLTQIIGRVEAATGKNIYFEK